MTMMMTLAGLLLLLLILNVKSHFGWSFVSRCQFSRSSTNLVKSATRHVASVSTTALLTADTPYLRTTSISEELAQKFQKLRIAFPDDANVVKAGGWYNLERLSVDPKQELVSIVTEGLKSTNDSKVQFGSSYDTHDEEKLEALLLLLYGMGKGFESDAIDGEWDLVFTKQGKKSPTFQKLVGTTETAGRSKNVFDVASRTFSGVVSFWKWGTVGTKVKVRHRDEGYEIANPPTLFRPFDLLKHTRMLDFFKSCLTCSISFVVNMGLVSSMIQVQNHSR
jgi:hypothetical protein